MASHLPNPTAHPFRVRISMQLLSFLTATFFLVEVVSASVTEFRVKVGDVLERLQYPNGLASIGDMGKETVLKLAVDFDTSKSHPKMTQFTLRPKNKSLQPLIYAMDYKSASSKAVLNIDFNKLPFGSVKSGEEYEAVAYLAGEKKITWKLGVIRTPKEVSNTIPEIEDFFHALPEIYTPEIEDHTRETRQSIVYLIFAGVVLIPWVVLLNSWSLAKISLAPPAALFSTKTSIFTPLFTLGVMCAFALILASWIKLSIFTQLAVLAGLVPPTAYFGFKTFQASTIAAEKEKSKPEKSD